jgi:hypothetical protein
MAVTSGGSGMSEIGKNVPHKDKIRLARVIFICSNCGGKHARKGQRYCVTCHNAYMRNWRKTHPLTAEQKLKDNARSYAFTYFKRGHIIKVPCESCGSPKSQMHHHDYSKPLDVEWFCRPCHMALHVEERRQEEKQIASIDEVAA